MTPQELEVMAVHALSIIIATELLAEASNQATAEDWLTLIMAKARTRYEELEPGQLQAHLDHVLKAWRAEPIDEQDRNETASEETWLSFPPENR